MTQSGELFQSLNSNGKNLQVNTQVITLTDNLSHPYFSIINLSKNNSYPIGSAILESAYTPYISNYWIKYKGIVIISFDLVSLDQTNTNSEQFLESNKIKQRIINEQYNYSFIGRVGQFKQKGEKFIIHIEDIGWKFLQKVPKEFRDTYIANQSLDKAFQAICEFLGVEFAYSIEDLSEYTFGADGYSITKDGQVVEDVETILSKWQTESPEEENKDDELDDPKNENPALIELDKKNEKNENYVKKDKQEDQQLDSDDSALQEQLDKYQEDFDQKIMDLFIGNQFYDSNVTDNVMDYNKITVTPTVSTDTSNSSDSIEQSEENKGEDASKKLLDNGKSGITLSNVNFKKIALSYSQVNALTPDQAYHESLQTNKYYHTTIIRLKARARLKYNIGPNTPYWRFK